VRVNARERSAASRVTQVATRLPLAATGHPPLPGHSGREGPNPLHEGAAGSEGFVARMDWYGLVPLHAGYRGQPQKLERSLRRVRSTIDVPPLGQASSLDPGAGR
jgi:hypothetical protein